MRAVFLGTGGTYPCTERNVTSVAVQIEKDVVLLDCGEGTQRQFMMSNVSFMSTRYVFISHFHGDHFLGLPGLIQSMNLNDRNEPIDIYGPKGTEELMRFLLTAGHFGPGYEIIAHDVHPGDELKFSKFRVISVEVDHTVPTLGYAIIENDRPGKFDTEKAAELGIPRGPLFRKLQSGESIEMKGETIEADQVLGPARKGRKLVYSGDTRPCSRLTSLAENAELLIHDATLLSTEGKLASDFGHSTAKEAAEVALEARVKDLALIHYSPRYKDAKCLEDEARSVFPRSFAPKDLDEFILRVSE